MTDSPLMLKQAIPYIRMYKGKTFVVKVGGRVVPPCLPLEGLDVGVGSVVGDRVRDQGVQVGAGQPV